jgi:hypothetical protein
MRFRLDLPDVDDSYALADWLEVMILRTGKPQVSRAHLIDALVAMLGSSPQELDVPVSLLFGEISRRRRIAGGGYPLIVDNTLIKLDVASTSEFYIFLLLISIDGPMRRANKYRDIEELFDNVVREALRGYLGPGTETLRFGWPPSEGRPATFAKALDWLADRVGLPVGSGLPPSKGKDGGLDVVAWKPFKDRRSAFVLAFVQCTVQSDWHPKAKDILDHVWLSRIDTGRPVVTSLAVPFVIPKNYPKWDELRRMTNIVFDRLRLAQLLAGRDPLPFLVMIRWSRKELAKFAV